MNRNRVVCKYHPDANLIEDCSAGDMICPECGLVVGERMIDVSAEWRTFSNTDGGKTDDPSRVGASQNPLLDGSDLTTIIGSQRGANSLDPAYLRQGRMSGLSNSDRLLRLAFSEISVMTDRINLPRTVSMRAQEIFKKIFVSENVKGRSTDAIATSCVYVACRLENVPRTLKEIIAISRVGKKEIGRTTRLILSALDMKIDVINSTDFMSRFCSNLGLDHHVQQAAKHVSQRVAELSLAAGRSPITIAATAIYLTSQASAEKRTMKEVGEICGVAASTIKLIYKLLQDRLPDLFPPSFTFHTPCNKLPHF